MAVSGVMPSAGPQTGATFVTVGGTNFPAVVDSVLIGTGRLASFMVASSSQITGLTPAGAAGSVNVTVYTATAGSASCTGCFTFRAFARYTVTFLGAGFDSSRAVAINDSGTVVGQVWTAATGWRGRLWPSERSATDLGELVPVGVNSAGTVVANSASGPVLWETGQVRALGGLSAPASSCAYEDSLCVYWATDINDQRQVALGWCSQPSCPYVGGGPTFLWQSDTLTRLSSPNNPSRNQQNGLCKLGRMNNRGEVTGYGCWGRAVVVTTASVRYLPQPDLSSSDAVAINDSGVVVGGGALIEGDGVGFAWPFGVLWFAPFDVNNSAQIVGSKVWNDLVHKDGILWQDSVTATLSSLVVDSTWQVRDAVAINDRGQIAGYGVNTATGVRGAIRLDPVATPSGSSAVRRR